MHPLGSRLQLAGSLSAAKHQHAQHRELLVRQVQRLREEMPILDRPAARTAREAHELALAEPLDRGTDRRLVVGDDWIAVRRLVAGRPQRVQRERVGIRRRPLLLDHAAEDADLGGIQVHDVGA